MVKIKLLIYLLLAGGVANAGVTLSFHGDRHPFDVKTDWIVGDADLIYKNLPDGWDKCVAHTRHSSPGHYVGKVTCYTTQGVIVSLSCVAHDRIKRDSAQMRLETSDKFDEKTFGTYKVDRWVEISCTYP